MPLPAAETDQPRAPRLTAAGVPVLGSDKDKPHAFMPLPSDDEAPPGETIAVLEEARAALLHVIGALFDAAVQIVGALLTLVQKLAGRDVAEGVDKAAADALDTVVPDFPLPAQNAPTGDTPGLPTGTTDSETTTPEEILPVEPAPASPEREAVMAEVRAILTTHASAEEQPKITDQLVDLVTSGVLFIYALEQQHPGLIERVVARDARPDADETSGDGAETVDRETPETPRASVAVSVN